MANTLTINYYSNYATSAYAEALNTVGADKNVLIGQWIVTSDSTFPDNLNNYCEIDGGGTSMRLDRIGYHGTGYWIIGYPENYDRIEQDEYFTSYSDICNKLGVSDSQLNVSVDLYAEWDPDAYTLYFDANGGINRSGGNFSYDDPNTDYPDTQYGEDESWVTVIYESPNFHDMSANIPTRVGYIFSGWYIMDGDTGEYITKVYDENGMYFTDGTYWKDGSYAMWSYPGDVLLHARWEEKVPPIIDLPIIYHRVGDKFVGGITYVNLKSGVIRKATTVYTKVDGIWKSSSQVEPLIDSNDKLIYDSEGKVVYVSRTSK